MPSGKASSSSGSKEAAPLKGLLLDVDGLPVPEPVVLEMNGTFNDCKDGVVLALSGGGRG